VSYPKWSKTRRCFIALSPLLFNFTLENANRKTHENQMGLKLNVTHQFLADDDVVNILGDNMNTKKKTQII
jgi:hypothetical protein